MSFTEPHMAVSAGLMLGAASTLSVGPNNLMLLREGLKRGHASTLAATVGGSESLLLLTAYAAADAIGSAAPLLRGFLLWFGLVALAVFAVQFLWAACSADAGPLAPSSRENRWTSVRRALLVVWCNPLSYLELLMVPAAICTSFANAASRLAFIATVLAVTGVRSFGYAQGGRLLASLVRSRQVVRAFDATAGLLMAGAAVAMGCRLMTWS